MVQRGIPFQQREFFSPARETNWHSTDRAFLDPTQDGRPKLIYVKTIEAALRDCVRLPVKEFALIVLLENGEEKTYTSQSLTPYQPRIFSNQFRQDFCRNVRRANPDAAYPGSAYPDGESMLAQFDADDYPKQSSGGDSSSAGRGTSLHQRKSRSEVFHEADSAKAKRKRARGSQYASFDQDDTPVPVPVVKAQALTIGNEAEVEQFYFTRFKDMQQSACKVMGKVFVKLVEPKKQTHHPYTGGAAKAPPWWPKTTGDDRVRHREPDHLLRPERIRLLVHILKLIIEPYERQCPAVQKLRLNVRKLEEVTMEAMTSWFNDPDHMENLSKKPFLKEIFKVAKAEERYKNGEIDRDTRIPVMYGDRSGVDYSDEEIDEGVKDEEEEPNTSQIPHNMPTPDSLGSQPMMQTQHLQGQEQEPHNIFMGPTRPLPMRYNTQPLLDEHHSYSNSSFLSRTVGGGFPAQPPSPQDPSRRSFGSPVYPSPQSMYAWQQTTMASNGTMNSGYYAPSPQTPLGSQGGPFQLPPPPTTPHLLPPLSQHPFDNLPPGRQYDSGPAMGSIVRTGSLGHPHHIPHGFQSYIHENGGYQNDSEVTVRGDEHQ